VGGFLAEEEPHIVTLTDVGRGSLSSGGTDPVPRLARLLGLPHVAAATAADLRGQVVLSVLPILETRTEPLPGPGSPRPDLVVAVLDARGLEVAVLTTRFIAGGDQETRTAQAHRTAEVVSDLERFNLPVVVTGTFWAQPDAAELEPLRDRLRSSDSPPTWPASDPRDTLDHVYVSERMTVRDLRVGPAPRGTNLPVSVVVDRG
jgi:endonuclease/exonuclease/phosphatase family metal-dependent hydrolase